MFRKTTTAVTSADKPMFTKACICFGLVIVFLLCCSFSFGLYIYFNKNLCVWSTGDPDEVHGRPHQTDE